MTFVIEEIDADAHRDELVTLYRAHGNRFFARIFDWYYSDNGAHGSRTWVARPAGGGIAGTVSVVFRDLLCRGEVVRAGIMGNLLVHSKFRSSFASVGLIRTGHDVLEDSESSPDLLLGFPVDGARELFTTLGHQRIGRLQSYTHPLSSAEVLGRRYGFLARTLGVVADTYAGGLRALHRVSSDAVVTEVEPSSLDPSLTDNWGAPQEEIVQAPSVAFLEWRSSRPDVESHAFTVRVRGRIAGLVSLDERANGTAELTYCAVDHGTVSRREVVASLLSALRSDFNAVSTATMPGSDLHKDLLVSGFLPRRGRAGEADELMGYWTSNDLLADTLACESAWSILPGINDI